MNLVRCDAGRAHGPRPSNRSIPITHTEETQQSRQDLAPKPACPLPLKRKERMKRKVEEESDSSDDEDFGPSIALAAPAEAKSKPRKRKRRKIKVLRHEKLYVSRLPCAEMYEKSYMHRRVVTHVVVAQATGFVVTASSEGAVKFWKKTEDGIDFVKVYRAHVRPLTSLTVSGDGQRMCSTSYDKTIKLYNVRGYDLNQIIKTAFVPGCSAWCYGNGSVKGGATSAGGGAPRALLAVSDHDSSAVHIYDPEIGGGKDPAVPVLSMSGLWVLARWKGGGGERKGEREGGRSTRRNRCTAHLQHL